MWSSVKEGTLEHATREPNAFMTTKLSANDTLRLIGADCRLPRKRSVVSRHLNIDRRLGSLHGLGASQDTGTGEAGE
jgi:hypothetical protein